MIRIEVEKKLRSAEGEMKLIVKTELHPGELLALYGPSGAGKTTLLRILAGLSKPDSGMIQMGETIWFDSGKKINIQPQLRNTGFMFQDYALFPNMTVEQNIRFACDKNDTMYANKLLQIFGLENLSNQRPLKLSGGQQQRVALARALARKPSLLLLDEPLSALDASLRKSLQDEIVKAHKMFGCATIMVSHDKNEILRLADRVIRIDQGIVLADGVPAEVFRDDV